MKDPGAGTLDAAYIHYIHGIISLSKCLEGKFNLWGGGGGIYIYIGSFPCTPPSDAQTIYRNSNPQIVTYRRLSLASFGLEHTQVIELATIAVYLTFNSEGSLPLLQSPGPQKHC